MLTIVNRVREELQQEANKRLQPDVDLSRERVGRRLDLASRMAEEQKNPAGIASSELGIAKVFGLATFRRKIDVFGTCGQWSGHGRTRPVTGGV
jgi:hypothetical protein